ncbi:hypothetical protein FRX31_027698 [Thalictrum thalictroides]|uniref:Uncharacterized protein n=1 Tax=Thalictrum thalictroides TaxID=46969 RepID=A0A7J6VC81_THATH|nr:hypothetical protein FRX31_027698 [Thalictrum thalictroides]
MVAGLLYLMPVERQYDSLMGGSLKILCWRMEMTSGYGSDGKSRREENLLPSVTFARSLFDSFNS